MYTKVFFFGNLQSTIDLGSVADQVDNTGGVTVLIVIPRDELDKVGVERDTSLGIKDGRAAVTQEIGGDNFILSVAENALKLVLRGSLDSFLDLIVRSTLLNANSQVNNRDIGVRDTEGHAGKLAVKVGNDLANSYT